MPKILPENVRPQLSVNANIIVAKLANVTFIERPANVKPYTEVALYQLNPISGDASLVKVKFGRLAGRYIEVLSGVAVDQQLIISDLANLTQTNQTIHIN